MSWLTSRRWLAAVALWLSAAGLLAAQQRGSVLDDYQRRQQVTSQAAKAAEEEILALIAAADRAKATDPAKANELLRKAMARLQADIHIDSKRWGELRTAIQQRQNSTAAPPVAGSEPPGRPAAAKPAVPPKIEPKDEDIIRRDLDFISYYRQQGRVRDAYNLAQDLARRYPNHPTVQQVYQSMANSQAIREALELREERSHNTRLAMNDVTRSSIPITGDIAYPKDWLTNPKYQNRLKKYEAGLVPLTEKEKAILRSLSDVLRQPLQIKDMPFEQVLQLLQKEIGHPILVNKAALQEVGITYETTVTASIPREVSKRYMLRRVLADLNLTYIIKNEVIEVTTLLRARNEMVVRFFPIDDFLGANGFFTTGFGINPNYQVEQLIGMIKQMVDPESWEPAGPGTITYDPVRRVLIIKNSAEVINALGGGRIP
jgi:hypothetical protein